MVFKVLYSAVTCLYMVSMMILLLFSSDNLRVIWNSSISDSNKTSTVSSSYHDTTLEDFIQSSCMVTLTILIFSLISLRQLNQRRNDLTTVSIYDGGHYGIMFLIWLLLSLMIFGSLFNYEPSYTTPYQKAYFQETYSNCSYYYTNTSYELCYEILPQLNVTNNNVCCLMIEPSDYQIIFNYSTILQIITIILYPIWLFITYCILQMDERTSAYVRLN